MRIPSSLLTTTAFVGAGIAAVLTAWTGAMVIENKSEAEVRSVLLTAGMTWTDVRASGLQVRLHGTAPNEAARFRALNLAGTVIESSRVRDRLDVAPVRAISAVMRERSARMTWGAQSGSAGHPCPVRSGAQHGAMSTGHPERLRPRHPRAGGAAV